MVCWTLLQANAAQVKRAAAGQALEKGPRNNNSPTKGLLASSGQQDTLLAALTCPCQ